jgi:hypothetical protein
MRKPSGQDVPGAEWMEILSRPTLSRFAAAFTAGACLDALVLPEPVYGPGPIREVFQASRTIYQQLTVVEETRSARRTCLEWEGLFCGLAVRGVTVLSHAADGAIERISLFHAPRGPLFAFASELERRLRPALPAPGAFFGRLDPEARISSTSPCA